MHEATVRTVCRELGLVADTALPRLNQLTLLPESLSTHDVEHVGTVSGGVHGVYRVHGVRCLAQGFLLVFFC